MTMLSQIVLHTPRWVFVLFFALMAIGLRQLMPSQPKLLRVSLLPVAMTGLSLVGLTNAFATQPIALLGWAVGAAVFLAAVMMRPLPAGTRFDAPSQRFGVPGSAMPLALMFGVFVIRYACGATLSLHPELAHDSVAAIAVGLLYGLVSGLFIGRAARLWRLALRSANAAFAA